MRAVITALLLTLLPPPLSAQVLTMRQIEEATGLGSKSVSLLEGGLLQFKGKRSTIRAKSMVVINGEMVLSGVEIVKNADSGSVFAERATLNDPKGVSAILNNAPTLRTADDCVPDVVFTLEMRKVSFSSSPNASTEKSLKEISSADRAMILYQAGRGCLVFKGAEVRNASFMGVNGSSGTISELSYAGHGDISKPFSFILKDVSLKSPEGQEIFTSKISSLTTSGISKDSAPIADVSITGSFTPSAFLYPDVNKRLGFEQGETSSFDVRAKTEKSDDGLRVSASLSADGVLSSDFSALLGVPLGTMSPFTVSLISASGKFKDSGLAEKTKRLTGRTPADVIRAGELPYVKEIAGTGLFQPYLDAIAQWVDDGRGGEVSFSISPESPLTVMDVGTDALLAPESVIKKLNIKRND